MKKLIKNVVALDMTKTTPEAIKGVTINNVVNVFVTPTTRPLVGQINFGNIVKTIEVPDKVAFTKINGNLVVDGNLEEQKNTFMFLNGDVIIKPDVTPEVLCNFFAGGAITNGDIILPDTIAAQFPLPNVDKNGDVQVYPADSLLFFRVDQINNGFLSSLPVGAKVTIIPEKELFIADDTDAESFKQHVAELNIFGNTVLPDELADVFYSVARQYNKVTVVPEGFTLYDKTLMVNTSNIMGMRGKKLYVRGDIVFKNGIDEGRVRQTDFQLETAGSVIVPENLAGDVFDKVKATNFYTYRGDLVIVKDELEISEVAIAEMTSYLVNMDAQLSFHRDISTDDIQKGIGEIFLYGFLSMYGKQAKFINDKLVVNEGDVEILSTEDDAKSEEAYKNEEFPENTEYDIVIGNAVEYVL